MRRIGVVVEGDGDQRAIPVVVRSYLHSVEVFDIEIGKPLNTRGRGKLLRAGELERFVHLAALETATTGVLVVCDADDDPACVLGPEITARCVASLPHVPVRACLAVREFENWLLASPETLAPGTEPVHDDYEAIASIPHISRWRAPRKYVKPLHQPALAAQIDRDRVAARCPSFARLLRCIDELVTIH
jgi:hypothetical protein